MPATEARRRLVEWTAGCLDLVTVRDTSASSRHYLVRGPATKSLQRSLASRSDRHRVMAAAATYLTRHEVDDLLVDDRHRAERAAAQRQGMHVHSRRTLIALCTILLLPLLLGLCASGLAYWWEWSFFGRRLLDAFFAFPMIAGAAFIALSPMFKLVEHCSRRDEQTSQAWLEEHAVGLMAGRMLVSTTPSPAEVLEDNDDVVELPPGLLPHLEEVLGQRREAMSLKPSAVTAAIWSLARAMKRAYRARADRVQALTEVSLSVDQLREMCLTGDVNAAGLLEWLGSLDGAAADAEEGARQRLEEVSALLDAGTARARSERAASALEKLAPQRVPALQDVRSDRVLPER